jgi:RimJ/RimL family protein N-acetyltransferase
MTGAWRNFVRMAARLIEPLTSRLRLRQWEDRDRAPFAALNADPLVMRHFPAPLTREQSDAMVDRLLQGLHTKGYGLWAVEVRATGAFIGFVGLSSPVWEAAFTPCTEVGWRLAQPAWGQGYATEAAQAALATGFGPVGLSDVVSFTTIGNVRSRRVMERLGMKRDPSEDFDHPLLSDDRLRRHVLYRLSRADWVSATAQPGA